MNRKLKNKLLIKCGIILMPGMALLAIGPFLLIKGLLAHGFYNSTIIITNNTIDLFTTWWGWLVMVFSFCIITMPLSLWKDIWNSPTEELNK